MPANFYFKHALGNLVQQYKTMSTIQYAPSTIVIFVDYPDLSMLLIFGLVTFIFFNIKFDSLETLYAFHCNQYFHKYVIFSNSRANTEYAPTLISLHPLSFPH